ncbi:hypothetical protein BJ165DRAFT_1608209 [Panaeolus papilionaceus]|nr:hypothetical protein BJ165DRAFT_1608209 [Panaeolus papilionaceus]
MANLDGADIKHIINGFLRENGDKQVQGLSGSLRALNKQSQTDLIHKILGTITDVNFYKSMMDALTTHIREHPLETAVFLIGVVLLCIPNLIMTGFGAPRSVNAASSLVALWKMSSGGTNAASSALVLIHGWGILVDVVLPAAGKVAGAVATEVGNWGSGQYGTPVENWMKGDYGRPVEKWWSGDYGNPVSSWFGSIFK